MARSISEKRRHERSPYLVALGDKTRHKDQHFASAAARNTEPILDVLRDELPEAGTALEIASGTGQHVTAFAQAFPGIGWQPSELDPAACKSIAAWIAQTGATNVREPLALDVTAPDWEAALSERLEAVVCINMVHISPWAACEGLMRGAGRLLAPGGLLYLYGPYKRGGEHTAPSNAEFDASLRQRNPAWGVRDLDEVATCAAAHGMELGRAVAMPANNFSVVFRRS